MDRRLPEAIEGVMIVHCRILKGAGMCGESDIREGIEARAEVCVAGIEFYRTALLAGRAARADAPGCVSAFGLVAPAVDDPEAMVPIPPSVATAALAHPMERLILEQQQALAAVRTSMSQAESVYRTARRKESESSQRLTPAPAITAALDEAIQGTKTELLTAHPGGRRPEEVLVKALPRTLEAHRKGVKQRTLYQHTVRAHGPTLDYIKQVTELGVEVRTVDEVFDRMIICDRAVAFIPDMGKDHGTHALRVTDPGVVHFLVSAFEYAWERAKPVVYEHDQQRPRSSPTRPGCTYCVSWSTATRTPPSPAGWASAPVPSPATSRRSATCSAATAVPSSPISRRRAACWRTGRRPTATANDGTEPRRRPSWRLPHRARRRLRPPGPEGSRTGSSVRRSGCRR